MVRWACLLFLVCSLGLLASCDSKKSDSKTIVLYTSIDEPVFRPIIKEFEKETGYTVFVRTDTEANKTVGLVERLISEKNTPQADVWWGNEPINTIKLAESGVLAEYNSPSHANIPQVFQDSKHRWAGMGLRARVIAVSDKLTDLKVTSINDLLKPELKGKIVMADPAVGSTSSYVAAIYALWGGDKTVDFFTKLKENDIKIVGGNSIVAELVARGEMLAGFTDNDDVEEMLKEGGKLKMVLPDQDSFGTLAFPTTVAVVKGGPNTDAAKKLVDYLLTAKTEQRLIDAKFARYSVFAKEGDNAIKTFKIEFASVVGQLDIARQKVRKILVEK